MTSLKRTIAHFVVWVVWWIWLVCPVWSSEDNQNNVSESHNLEEPPEEEPLVESSPISKAEILLSIQRRSRQVEVLLQDAKARLQTPIDDDEDVGGITDDERLSLERKVELYSRKLEMLQMTPDSTELERVRIRLERREAFLRIKEKARQSSPTSPVSPRQTSETSEAKVHNSSKAKSNGTTAASDKTPSQTNAATDQNGEHNGEVAVDELDAADDSGSSSVGVDEDDGIDIYEDDEL